MKNAGMSDSDLRRERSLAEATELHERG